MIKIRVAAEPQAVPAYHRPYLNCYYLPADCRAGCHCRHSVMATATGSDSGWVKVKVKAMAKDLGWVTDWVKDSATVTGSDWVKVKVPAFSLPVSSRCR